MTLSDTVVLVADDEPDIRLVVAEVLEDALGVCSALASDGAEALERLRACRPRLLVLDWMMPHVDGCAVCGALRASPPGWPLSVVVMSAAPVRELALGVGCAAFLPKPFDVDELVAVARRCLGL